MDHSLTGRQQSAVMIFLHTRYGIISHLVSLTLTMPTGAYLNLAVSYWWLWVSQQSPAGQTLEPAVAAIQRALALNDSFHWNHLTLGYIHLSQQQYEQALVEMERGVALAQDGGVLQQLCAFHRTDCDLEILNVSRGQNICHLTHEDRRFPI
jgi:tetratricopeptide (TPR) repeat protein